MTHLSKCETCPECRAELSQSDYDLQACPCGWGPFGVPSINVVTKIRNAIVAKETETGRPAIRVVLDAQEMGRLLTAIDRPELAQLIVSKGDSGELPLTITVRGVPVVLSKRTHGITVMVKSKILQRKGYIHL